jgi:hypothetical protein
MFIIKTLADKIVKAGRERLYTCFVNFRKAFDSLSHETLFHKIQSLGIGAQYYNLIVDMCKLCVKSGGFISGTFGSDVGVRQGDNLSPNLFKMFIHDMPNIIDDQCHPPTLATSKIGCLLFADDAIFLSKTANGLQRILNRLSLYCDSLGLRVNIKKTKVMIMNPTGRTISVPFTYNGEIIECTSEYKYLGTYFTASGSFQRATEDLYKKV